MALGDLIGIEIPAIGNRAVLTFESMAVGGTWDLGPWANNTPAGASIVLTVQCPGNDGAGLSDPKTRTIYGIPHQASLYAGNPGTTVMRKPHTGTGDPVPDETDSAGNIVAPVFLSGVLHGSDTITNIEVAGGTYNDGTNDNNAYSGDGTGMLTYSSTRVYPTPDFSWDSVDGAIFGDLLDADFRLAGWAKNLYGVAAVRFTVTDQSANELDVFVTEDSLRMRANGEFIFNHRSEPFSIATFAQGDTLTLRARVYPVIGDVIFDTADHTTEALVGLGRNNGTAICNKTGALTVKRYVSTTGDNGNDGLTPSTPWATIVHAVQQNANEIRLMAGDHAGAVDPGVRKVNTHWFRILPAEGEDASTVAILLPATVSSDIKFLQLEGITVKASTANCGYVGSSEDMLRVRRCVGDRNGQADAGANHGFNNMPWLSFEECAGDWGAKWEIHAPGITLSAVRIDGTNMESEAAGSQRMQYVTLCAGANLENLGLRHGAAENSHENIMIQNVACWDVDINATAFDFGLWAMEGFWAENVIVEVQNNLAQCFSIGTNVDSTHAIYQHMVHAGQRSAQFYNDTGTNNFQGRHTVSRFNFLDEYGTKHDDFITQNAARVGHWEHMMAVESGWDYVYEGTFRRQFAGLYAEIDDGAGAPTRIFVHDASNVNRLGDGTGHGDYRDTNFATNRRLYTPPAWERNTRWDRTGRSRGTECVSPGGYTYLGPDLPVPNSPTNLAQV